MCGSDRHLGRRADPPGKLFRAEQREHVEAVDGVGGPVSGLDPRRVAHVAVAKEPVAAGRQHAVPEPGAPALAAPRRLAPHVQVGVGHEIGQPPRPRQIVLVVGVAECAHSALNLEGGGGAVGRAPPLLRPRRSLAHVLAPVVEVGVADRHGRRRGGDLKQALNPVGRGVADEDDVGASSSRHEGRVECERRTARHGVRGRREERRAGPHRSEFSAPEASRS